MNTVCELLDWDTRFFAVRIARVVGDSLDETTAQQVLSWCASEQIDCLYFLADANSQESIATVERHAAQFQRHDDERMGGQRGGG